MILIFEIKINDLYTALTQHRSEIRWTTLYFGWMVNPPLWQKGDRNWDHPTYSSAICIYRDEIYSLQNLLSRTQAGPGRTVKKEQQEISPNHVQRINLISVDRAAQHSGMKGACEWHASIQHVPRCTEPENMACTWFGEICSFTLNNSRSNFTKPRTSHIFGLCILNLQKKTRFWPLVTKRPSVLNL